MIEYNDKVLAERLALQRNIALNSLAEAEAACLALQGKIAEMEKTMALLLDPRTHKGRKTRP